MLLFPQQLQEFPQLQLQLQGLQLQELQLQELQLQELPQELLLPPQHPSRMMIRMIHRQLLLPLFHMFLFTSLVCHWAILCVGRAKSSLAGKKYFSTTKRRRSLP